MWVLFNGPKVVETPPQSPDLNQIENYNFERKKLCALDGIRTRAKAQKNFLSKLSSICLSDIPKIVGMSSKEECIKHQKSQNVS